VSERCFLTIHRLPSPFIIRFCLLEMESSSIYRSHPVFAYRVALLVDCAAGLGFTSFTAVDSYISFHSLFALILMLFILSIAVCCYDLVEWAINKSRTTESSKWPLKVVLLADLILAALFIVAYIKELIDLNHFRYRTGVGIITTYGTLPPLLAAMLHGICVFKQLGVQRKAGLWRALKPFANRTGRIRIEEEGENISAGA